MGYTQLTFQQLVNQFALRLSDPGQKFWIGAEMQSYLIEALRTWQVMSAYLSINVTVPLTANGLFVDLTQVVSQVSPTVTDQNIIQDIQQALQEPVSLTSWTGTEQFNYTQMVNAIQSRLDKFLLETGIYISVLEVSAASNIVTLPDTVIDVRRAMWRTPDNIYSVMWKIDPLQLAAQTPQWTTAVSSLYPPTDYTVGLQLPLTLEMDSTPTVPGYVNMLVVQSSPILTPASGATILGIPDDLCWVIKFGALADMLSAAGPGQDLVRAAYCESRWNDGIRIARITNVIRQGFINGLPAFVDSLSELDQSSPDWVSALANVPQFLGASGNILAASPIIDNTNPTLTLDITPKFPVPALSDYIQIGKENLDVILDYAEHLAHFKEGMSEITTSMQLYKNLLNLAAVQNDRLRMVVRTFDVMADRSTIEKHTNPRRVSDVNQEVLSYSQS